METPEENINAEQSNNQPIASTSQNYLEQPKNCSRKKGSAPKGKKRKNSHTYQTAPRQPHSGDINSLNDQERYLLDPSRFKKTEAHGSEEESTIKKAKNVFTDCNIPIFTEESLDHNKDQEAELKKLRKIKTYYKQQKATLKEREDNLRAALDQLTAKTNQYRKNNTILEQQLKDMKSRLVKGFSSLRLPGTKETASLKNIEAYMDKLHSFMMDPNNINKEFTNKVKEIVSTIKFDETI